MMLDGFDDAPLIDSTKVKLNDIVPKDGEPLQFAYCCDFGDNWQHEIVFEGCVLGRHP